MGMLIYDALVIAKASQKLAKRDNVLTLGVPTLNFSAAHFFRAFAELDDENFAPDAPRDFSTPAEFFKLLGFQRVDALDISDYEGANIIGDLNDPSLGERIGARYDLVYDSGTIEHIFDIATALRTINRVTGVGGAVVHATPSNGFLDHGFWQVSPDLFRSFYGSAGFRCLTSALFVLGPQPYFVRADTNIYRNLGRPFIVRNLPESIAVFGALKETDLPMQDVGLQEYYGDMHGESGTRMSSAFYVPYGSIFWGRLKRWRIVRAAFWVAWAALLIPKRIVRAAMHSKSR